MPTSTALRRARAADRSRGRSILLNQLLFGAVVILAVALVLMFDMVGDGSKLVIGTAIVFLGTGMAVSLPWGRLQPWTMLLIPVLDVFAVAMLRDAAPSALLGLIWTFPAMWIASVFGMLGAAWAVVLMCLIFTLAIFMNPANVTGPQVFLLPLLLAALSAMSYLGARRATAQRLVLDKQSRHLQQSMARARRQEDLVSDVLDAVDFGVIRLSADGDMVVANDAHARLQKAAAPTKTAYAADGITPRDPESLPLARARRGELFENELAWYGEPGEARRALRSTARRITAPDVRDAGTLIVTRDVTAEELALRARDDLLASVSHELRTPLTSVIGYVELAMEDPAVPDSTRRSLEVAERNAQRLLDLIADILAVAAGSQKGVDLSIHPETVDLAPVVRGAVEAVEPYARERRISIDAVGIERAIAHADPQRIRQVVDNLLANAIKYNFDSGHVEVGTAQDGPHAWIVVRDDGPGISEQEQPSLFQRFFRSETVRNTSTHGSGLGLAISKDIVRSHGGEITVRSVFGEGTTFIVRLPAHDPRGGAR